MFILNCQFNEKLILRGTEVKIKTPILHITVAMKKILPLMVSTPKVPNNKFSK